MIKMYTAYTAQVDDPEAAAQEILAQLELDKNKLKNTAGLAFFNDDYPQTGAYQAIIEALPFPVVGCSTTIVSTLGEYGEYSLTITMFTSNDVSFSIESVDMENKSFEEIDSDVQSACGEMSKAGKPKLIIPLMSVTSGYSGDDLLVSIDKATGGDVPVFGTLAFNSDGNINYNIVTCNEACNTFIISFLAFHGDFKPVFRVVNSINYNDIVGETGVVTESKGPVIKTINGQPANEFLFKQGVAKKESTEMLVWAVPAVLELPDGSHITLAFHGAPPDDPNAIFSSGNPVQNSKISFAFLDRERILKGALELFEQYKKENYENTLSFSCAARSWTCGTEYMAEVEHVTNYAKDQKAKTGKMPNYSFCYSAGEICPVPNKEGKLVNKLHNYTLISCAFE